MANFSSEANVPISERWEELNETRKKAFDRALKMAEITIPALMRTDSTDPDNDLEYSFDSVGARAVNNLVNKLALALMNPSAPFFKLTPTADYAQELKSGGDVVFQQALSALTTVENIAVDKLESKRMRPLLYRLLTQLVVTGNALLILKKDEAPILRTLRNYAVVLSDDKELLELVIKRTVMPKELDEDLQSLVTDKADDETVDVYVRVFWDGSKYQEYAGIDDEIITKSEYTAEYDKESLPYHHIQWESVEGASYGIGQVEMYEGDLNAISRNTEAATVLALVKREVRILVAPEAMVDVEELNKAPVGTFVAGDARFINSFVPAADTEIQSIYPVIENAVRRVSAGFLIASGMTRDAERVTAAEVREQAMELETSLGGVYTRLSGNLQYPIVAWIMEEIDLKANDLDGINILIVTGLDALGRKYDNSVILAFINDCIQIGGLPPEVSKYLKIDSIITQLANGYGLDESKFIYSEQERDAVEQQAQQAQAQVAGEQEAAVEAGKIQGQLAGGM